jgi:hypothetical protein
MDTIDSLKLILTRMDTAYDAILDWEETSKRQSMTIRRLLQDDKLDSISDYCEKRYTELEQAMQNLNTINLRGWNLEVCEFMPLWYGLASEAEYAVRSSVVSGREQNKWFACKGRGAMLWFLNDCGHKSQQFKDTFTYIQGEYFHTSKLLLREYEGSAYYAIPPEVTPASVDELLEAALNY